MAQNLAQNFIDLRGFRLAPKPLPELGFNHAESGFDVAVPVVALHKPLLVVAEEMIHALPRLIARPVTGLLFDLK